MSVALATQNPDAHKRLSNPVLLPAVTTWVNYYFRPGEIRAGKQFVPALVLGRDEANNVLTLMVVIDHQDMITAERVPMRIGNEMGWALPEGSTAALEARCAAAEAAAADCATRLQAFMDEMSDCLFGKNGMPEGNYEDRIQALTVKLGEVAKAVGAGKPPKAKRR